ncbi:serine hydrolase domain-containing protein [Pirellulaceae bacterium SH449]
MYRLRSTQLVAFVFLFTSAIQLGFGRLDDIGKPDDRPHLFSAEVKAVVSELVDQSIRSSSLPGCVIEVGNAEGPLFLKAFGNRSIEPLVEPMTTDTIFDLASLTKPIATASAIHLLVESGKLKLDHRVSLHLPHFGQNGKDRITVLDCLVHRSGLIPDNALRDYQQGPQIAWERIYELPLHAPIGQKFQYSDVNFLVLGKLVEVLSQQSLERFVQEKVLTPCHMHETNFGVDAEKIDRVAPTEKRNGEWIRGEVHDPRAHLLGGVAGHAGLFSTAGDLGQFARLILNDGAIVSTDGSVRKVFQKETIDTLFSSFDVHGDLRSPGWDMQSRYSSNKGTLLSEQSIGHGGFTGTVLWIDRARGMYFCFLSSRLHPNGKGSVNQLAGTIWDTILNGRSPAEDH